MNASLQAVWFFCLLIVLAFSGWYFSKAAPKPMLSAEALANSEDAIINKVTVRQFTKQGTLANFLQADEIRHIPNHDKHLLLSPYIIIHQNNDPPWEIRSKKAVSLHRGAKITFQDDVVIHQNQTSKQEESTLHTERLVYFPQRKFATTKSKVLFTQLDKDIHSKGMNVYLEDKHIELLRKAQIVYHPKHA